MEARDTLLEVFTDSQRAFLSSHRDFCFMLWFHSADAHRFLSSVSGQDSPRHQTSIGVCPSKIQSQSSKNIETYFKPYVTLLFCFFSVLMPWCVLSWRLSPRHPAISCRCTNPCLCLGWDYSHSLLLCSYDLCIKYPRVFTVQTMLPHTSPQMLIKNNFQLLDVQNSNGELLSPLLFGLSS